MVRIIIILAALVLGLWLWQWVKAGYLKQGRPFAVKVFIATIAIILLALAAMGRVHWLGAVLASLLAAIRFALPFILRNIPMLHNLLKRAGIHSQQTHQQHQTSSTQMNETEAYAILGLGPNASDEEIVAAHRRLIQKLHPDRGGNEYLATQLNLAKDALLKR